MGIKLAYNLMLILGVLGILILLFVYWYVCRIITRWFHDMLQCLSSIVRNTEKISEKINTIEDKVSFIENYYSDYNNNEDNRENGE